MERTRVDAVNEQERRACYGLVCALPEELGSLADQPAEQRRLQGLEVRELDLAGVPLLACVSGVGKVRAACAASVLIGAGAEAGLLMVGVCGGLQQALAPGTLVHCERALQWDGKAHERAADPELLAAWRAEVPGELASFLTGDRPVLSLARRWRLAGRVRGPCVADMETAAVAAAATAAGVPWAALRAVTDRATRAGLVAFRRHYPQQAGRAADTVCGLLQRLGPPRPRLLARPTKG